MIPIRPTTRLTITSLCPNHGEGGDQDDVRQTSTGAPTADPTGAYFLYSFAYGSTLNDYPKFGVWPTTTNSAFLATFNLFANGQTFTGGQLCAYDRTKMLAGKPDSTGHLLHD
jgi:hypothetical protein